MNTRLHLVIGFSSLKQKSEPTVIYCGRDGLAARDAMAPDPAFAMKKWVRNPRGVRKVNPDFVSGVADSVPASDPGEGDLSGASEAVEGEMAPAGEKAEELPAPDVADLIPDESSETPSAGSMTPKGKKSKE